MERTMTDPRPLSSDLAVGGQPTLDDLHRLQAAGFATVIDLRLPGEAGQALDPAAEEAAAVAGGLGYRHLPVALDALEPGLVEDLRHAIRASRGPVYVHCGAGQQACALALLATGDKLATVGDELMARAAALGFPVRDERLASFVRELSERERLTLQQAI
jgi:uncharacterized protein (TIGR01244 family)